MRFRCGVELAAAHLFPAALPRLEKSAGAFFAGCRSIGHQTGWNQVDRYNRIDRAPGMCPIIAPHSTAIG